MKTIHLLLSLVLLFTFNPFLQAIDTNLDIMPELIELGYTPTGFYQNKRLFQWFVALNEESFILTTDEQKACLLNIKFLAHISDNVESIKSIARKLSKRTNDSSTFLEAAYRHIKRGQLEKNREEDPITYENEHKDQEYRNFNPYVLYKYLR